MLTLYSGAWCTPHHDKAAHPVAPKTQHFTSFGHDHWLRVYLLKPFYLPFSLLVILKLNETFTHVRMVISRLGQDSDFNQFNWQLMDSDNLSRKQLIIKIIVFLQLAARHTNVQTLGILIKLINYRLIPSYHSQLNLNCLKLLLVRSCDIPMLG